MERAAKVVGKVCWHLERPMSCAKETYIICKRDPLHVKKRPIFCGRQGVLAFGETLRDHVVYWKEPNGRSILISYATESIKRLSSVRGCVVSVHNLSHMCENLYYGVRGCVQRP